jgi:dTDP-4-amino-4,6-dideoxygalactose transaminase
MKVLFNDLKAQNEQLKLAFLLKAEDLFEKGDYILGGEVAKFEKKFAEFVGTKYAVGVSSGTDAVRLAIESIIEANNTLIITQANTFIATVIAANQVSCKAKISLVDIDDYYQMDMDELESRLEEASVEYDNVIVVPVSMYGHTFDKRKLEELKNKYNFKVVEDSSQAHGSKFFDKTCSGSFGDVSAFSLYPGKNLGGIGDGGILTTSSKKIRDRLLALRNYGSVTKYEHPIIGYNNRLDTIQAAFLNEKIKFIRQYNDARVNIAKIYHNTINHKDVVNFQNAHYCNKNTYHVYPIRTANRCAMAKHLLRNGVETAIHYPTPVEETGAFSKKFSESHNKKTRIFSRNVLSLPIHPFMTESQAMHVVSVINSF